MEAEGNKQLKNQIFGVDVKEPQKQNKRLIQKQH